MVTSRASTVKEYLTALPADRRAIVETVRGVILKNLGEGYEEGMLYGMIGYFIPHRLYPAGFHVDPRQPVVLAALAAQKHYTSFYLGGLYHGTRDSEWLVAEWAKTGKKLDRGKGCIRFRKIEDLPLDLIGKAIARFPLRRYVKQYEAALRASTASRPRRR